MFTTRFIRPSRIPTSTRQFSLTVARRDTKPTVTESQASKPSTNNHAGSSADTQGVLGGHKYNVNNFDRWMLVWVKRFPNKAEVPEAVTHECILAARSKARIKVCNYMIVIFIIGFASAIFTGKKNAASGNTIIKRNEDWHKRIHDEAQAASAGKATAS